MALERRSLQPSHSLKLLSKVWRATPGATIDGVSMAASDRVLLKDQTTTTQNGIYIWNGASTSLTRAVDADTFGELEGAVVDVEEGTANAGTSWRQTAVNGVIGTDAILFTNFATTTPDASESVKGKLQLATQAQTDTGTNDLTAVTPLKLATSVWAAHHFSQLIGDGSATQIDVTHGFGTRLVHVTVYRNSGNYDTIDCDIGRTSTNAVRLNFTIAPTSNQFMVVITKGTN
jgi:hypothetical protein